MTAASPAHRFTGVVCVKDDRLLLASGGIEVEIEAADAAQARALRGLVGQRVALVGRQDRAKIIDARVAPQPESAVPGASRMQEVFDTIRANESRLRAIPGVLGVRPGFRVVRGALTSEPAVVVVVDRKRPLDAVPEGERIPSRLGDTWVDVLEAGPSERMGGVGSLDEWEQLATGLGPQTEAAPAIGYQPPPDLALLEVKVSHVICHVGPDAGWKVLGPFLEGTRERLTVAMYDFYAPQISDVMVRLGAEVRVRLELILQKSRPDETTVVSRLQNAWQDRLDFAPAVVTGPNRVFANSYHTKVAVRDGTSFWLSSGNWTPTSQPVIPLGPQPTLYNRGNREWHVIVQHEPLARLFEEFIRWDIKQARRAGEAEAAPMMPDLLVPESFFLEPEAAFVQPQPFEPRHFPTDGDDPIRVEPLLTPDNYPDAILNLLRGATHTLFMQYSYVRPPRDNDRYRQILDTVRDKMAAGVDVRIIVGSNQEVEHTQKLQLLGWDLTRMRSQRSKVHNKGILIDGRIAVVGSQNWSPDGTQRNRDASLVFHSPSIARYFTEVFLFDWTNLTRPVSMPELAPTIADSEHTPAGMVRVPWEAWYNE